MLPVCCHGKTHDDIEALRAGTSVRNDLHTGGRWPAVVSNSFEGTSAREGGGCLSPTLDRPRSPMRSSVI